MRSAWQRDQRQRTEDPPPVSLPGGCRAEQDDAPGGEAALVELPAPKLAPVEGRHEGVAFDGWRPLPLQDAKGQLRGQATVRLVAHHLPTHDLADTQHGGGPVDRCARRGGDAGRRRPRDEPLSRGIQTEGSHQDHGVRRERRNPGQDVGHRHLAEIGDLQAALIGGELLARGGQPDPVRCGGPSDDDDTPGSGVEGQRGFESSRPPLGQPRAGDVPVQRDVGGGGAIDRGEDDRGPGE
jgi:hypothetical protein